MWFWFLVSVSEILCFSFATASTFLYVWTSCVIVKGLSMMHVKVRKQNISACFVVITLMHMYVSTTDVCNWDTMLRAGASEPLRSHSKCCSNNTYRSATRCSGTVWPEVRTRINCERHKGIKWSNKAAVVLDARIAIERVRDSLIHTSISRFKFGFALGRRDDSHSSVDSWETNKCIVSWKVSEWETMIGS